MANLARKGMPRRPQQTGAIARGAMMYTTATLYAMAAHDGF
jgi:hypothetical protein